MWKRKRQEDEYDMDNDDDDLGQRKPKMIRVRDDDLGDDADTSTPPEAGLDEVDNQHPPKLGSDSDQPNQLTQPTEAINLFQFRKDDAPLQCPSEPDDVAQDLDRMVSDNRRSVQCNRNVSSNPTVSLAELEKMLDMIQLSDQWSMLKSDE